MSKPRRPRNARPAHKPFAAKAGASVTAPPISAAESPAADPVPVALTLADVAPEHGEEGTDAGADSTVAALAATDEAPDPSPEAVAPSASLSPVAAPPYAAPSFGSTVMNYVIGEGEAFAAHLRALAGARSTAEFVRLQIGEFQRAADATLTCWGVLALSASRTVSLR